MTEVDRGTYAPLPDDPELEIEDVEEHGRGPFLLFVALIVLLAFAGVVYVAYQQGVQAGLRQSRGTNLPLIVAEPGPMKIEPKGDEAEGFEEPFQDMRVLNGDATEPKTETLLPPPEEPVEEPQPQKPATTAEATPAPVAAPAGPEVLPLDQEEPVAPAARPTEPVEIVTGAEETTTVASGPMPPAMPPGAAEPLQPEPFSTTEPKPAPQSAPEPAPQAAAPPQATGPQTAPAIVSAVSGSFVVQVASVPANDLALAKQAEITRKHGPVLSDLAFDIAKADLGERGTFYRLRIGPFSTRDDAIKLCESLKSRGQDCYVTTP